MDTAHVLGTLQACECEQVSHKTDTLQTLNQEYYHQLQYYSLNLPAVTSSTARFSSALEVSISSSLSLWVPSHTFLTGGCHDRSASMSILHSHTHTCPLRLSVVRSRDPFSKKQATTESVWLPKEYVLKLASLSRLYSFVFISFDPTARTLTDN